MGKFSKLISSPKNRKYAKYIFIGLFGFFYLLLFYFFHKYDIKRENLDFLLGPFQQYGLLALFVMQVIFSLTPFPDNFLIYAGVLIFGPLETFLAIYVSYLLATSIHFWIARHYGKDWVYKKFPKVKDGMVKYDHLFNAHNLIVFRFISFNTFDILAYAAGFSSISYRSYLISSMISMPLLILPGILFFEGLFAESQSTLLLVYGTTAIILVSLYFLTKRAEENFSKKQNG